MARANKAYQKKGKSSFSLVDLPWTDNFWQLRFLKLPFMNATTFLNFFIIMDTPQVIQFNYMMLKKKKKKKKSLNPLLTICNN